MQISILGFGHVGQKLANLFHSAGHTVTVGVRHQPQTTNASYEFTSLADAARASDIIILAIPYQATLEVLPDLTNTLTDKIIIDATNPLDSDWSPLLLGEENSAAEEIARLLPLSRVVKAFNTIFADVMQSDRMIRCSVPITAFFAGDDAAAKKQVSGLLSDLGFAPLDTGPLRMARYLEALAHLNINIAVAQGGGTNAAFLYAQERP